MSNGESIIVSIAGSGDNTILLVGQQKSNDTLEVINTLQGEEAINIFNKLKGVIDND